ncbi:DUF4440 domain-containing protein [Pseudonocardia nematodicida]|uniref:DUF4440 domain-containing protein n=1 Tax=Pseudonocardia nematodicida TaxID=1206997 RepID=A0ABV1KAZ5_9PSEU
MDNASDVDTEDVDELVTLERRLQEPATRRDRAVVEELLDPRFHEFGSSGREWDRASTVEMLATADHPAPEMTVLGAVRLSGDAVLLTYRTRDDRGATLRSSIWCRADGRWRLVFHQGTPQHPGS